MHHDKKVNLRRVHCSQKRSKYNISFEIISKWNTCTRVTFFARICYLHQLMFGSPPKDRIRESEFGVVNSIRKFSRFRSYMESEILRNGTKGLASISKLFFKKWRRYFFITERIDNHCMYSERCREVKYIYSPSFRQAGNKRVHTVKSQSNKCIAQGYKWLYMIHESKKSIQSHQLSNILAESDII